MVQGMAPRALRVRGHAGERFHGIDKAKKQGGHMGVVMKIRPQESPLHADTYVYMLLVFIFR